MSRRLAATAAAISLSVAWGAWGYSSQAFADRQVSIEGEGLSELVITEPFFPAPEVISPEPGQVPQLVQGPEEQWFWLLEVTNSDYQPEFRASGGEPEYQTLPSVGIFDTVAERLEWTNDTFACFTGLSCEDPERTADQLAFGEDFVKVPKLYDPTTNRVAYHAEHAYEAAQDPYEWLVWQETLFLAIPHAATPSGVIDIWVGYTYVYNEELEGFALRFTEEAMAITYTSVDIPPLPTDNGGVPLWVVQAVLGIVGILAIFGIIALIVSRMVAITRQNR